MSTHSKNSLKENIIEIFGLSSFKQLAKFEQIEPDNEALVEFKVKAPKNEQTGQESLAEHGSDDKPIFSVLFQMEGFISDSSHGNGRSAPDRHSNFFLNIYLKRKFFLIFI